LKLAGNDAGRETEYIRLLTLSAGIFHHSFIPKVLPDSLLRSYINSRMNVVLNDDSMLAKKGEELDSMSLYELQQAVLLRGYKPPFASKSIVADTDASNTAKVSSENLPAIKSHAEASVELMEWLKVMGWEPGASKPPLLLTNDQQETVFQPTLLSKGEKTENKLSHKEMMLWLMAANTIISRS
jgi:hypothetical protein